MVFYFKWNKNRDKCFYIESFGEALITIKESIIFLLFTFHRMLALPPDFGQCLVITTHFLFLCISLCIKMKVLTAKKWQINVALTHLNY